ncbi:MAG: TonB-dependent receptor [Myxococcales bacterium]|nr:TonB-dependent receptor [Myxococcales bacterium]
MGAPGDAAPGTTVRSPDVPACRSSLDGHVVDAISHDVIPGATVRVDDHVVAETDAEGRFVLTARCDRTVDLQVDRADYQVAHRTVDLAAVTSIELALEPFDQEVIEVRAKAPDPTDMRSTTAISGDKLERTRGRAFSEALTEVPGVSQLGSGTGMAKPMIRGQYGRRLLILVDGIRHRAQEWGLDHAPEIDPFIADKLTVVRGASGVRYGPDAIGGAILADPPDLLDAPGYAGEAHLVGMINGHGGALASRLQWASRDIPGLAVQLLGTYKRLASASTPDYPLDNTGSLTWNLGATVGYRKRGDYKVSYLHYEAELGVCTCLRHGTVAEFYAQLARDRPIGVDTYRADFTIERPSQAITHDLALARAQWNVGELGTITGSYGFQYDHRREYDIVRQAVSGPQFNFRLMTNELDLAFEHRPLHLTDHLHLRGSSGVIGMAQAQRYSGLPLVPDYTAWGAGVYAIERVVGHDGELEAGVRYDVLARRADLERINFLRLVRSGQLAMDACDMSASDPVGCASTFHTLSASLGGLRRLTDAWTVKLDLSTASRPPNPDEQYINGSSPTFPVLGLGKPDLRPETTYSATTTTSYHGTRVVAEASAYANLIDNYIYFAPARDAAGAPIFDVLIRGTFPRFVTRAVDSVFYGGDGGVTVTPVPALELGAQLSVVRARTRQGEYLVFVPADRVRGSATYHPPAVLGFVSSFVSLTGEYVAKQHRFDLAADFAAPPNAYFLLGTELGTETQVGAQTLKVALQGTNLLNTRYRNYTSLVRYFADQPGWQVMLRVSLHLSSTSPRNRPR